MRLAIVAMALVVGIGGAALAQGTKSDSNPASAGKGLSSTPGEQIRGTRRRAKSDTHPGGKSDGTDLSTRERTEQMQRRQDALDGSTMRAICSNCDSSGAQTGNGKAGKKRRRG